MPNQISGTSQDHIKCDELTIDLRANGESIASAKANDVWLTVEFSYECGAKERKFAGMPEDFNEPELAQVAVTSIKARNSVMFDGACGTVYLVQGSDMTPFLTRHEVEEIESGLLKRVGAM